jgi:hypothetical protein
LSDQELLDYSGEHVAYEVSMLKWTRDMLARGGIGIPLRYALIESWVVHLRTLVEFLCPRRPRDNDVIAADFFDDPEEWGRTRPSLSESLESLREAWVRADKELAHLTTNRKGPEDPSKGWAVHDLTDDLLCMLRKFSEKASKTKLHQKVRDALA